MGSSFFSTGFSRLLSRGVPGNVCCMAKDSSRLTSDLGVEELNALVEVGRAVSSHLALDEVLESIMEVTAKVMKVEAASLAIREE